MLISLARSLISISLLFSLTSVALFGHEITLKNGGKVKGFILKSDNVEYKIRTRGAVVTLKTADILSVDNTVHDEFETLYEEYTGMEKNAQNLIKLANAAREKGYNSFHLDLCRELLSIDPQNAMARDASAVRRDIASDGTGRTSAPARSPGRQSTGPVESKIDTLLKSARDTKSEIARLASEIKSYDPAAELKKALSRSNEYRAQTYYGSPYLDAQIESQRYWYFNQLYQSVRNNRFYSGYYSQPAYSYGGYYGGYAPFEGGYSSFGLTSPLYSYPYYNAPFFNRFVYIRSSKNRYLRIGF